MVLKVTGLDKIIKRQHVGESKGAGIDSLGSISASHLPDDLREVTEPVCVSVSLFVEQG